MRKFRIWMASLGLGLIFSSSGLASTLTIFDNSFEVYFEGTSLTNTTLTAVWGTFVGGNFNPNGLLYADGGYGPVDLTAGSPELQVIINRTDANQYAAGTLLSLAIFHRPDRSNWDGTVARAVLSDPSWTAPAWSLVGNNKNVIFTPNTTAQVGQFTYAATGNDVITIVPEPSTGLLFCSGALLCLIRSRRRVGNSKGS